MFISNNQIIFSNIKTSQNIMTMIVEKHKINDRNIINFIRTNHPNHQFSFYEFKICITSTSNIELQKVFNDKILLLTTYQSKTRRNMLAREKFDSNNVIYILICKTCNSFYLGQIRYFK